MDSDIIQIELDDINNASYRNPLKLTSCVKEKAKDSNRYYYVFIDEIQLVLKIINLAFTNGKIIACKGIDDFYLQASDNIDLEITKKRELAPFKLIRDANRKYLIINKPISPMKLEGGIILDGVVDFILNLH